MAYTAGTKYIVDSPGGSYKTVHLAVTPDGATGTVSFSTELSSILSAQVTFSADATANCYSISTSVSSTTLTIKIWKAGGTAADTAYVAMYVTVFGAAATNS